MQTGYLDIRFQTKDGQQWLDTLTGQYMNLEDYLAFVSSSEYQQYIAKDPNCPEIQFEFIKG